MANESDIDLFQQGKDEWNKWAQERLAEKEELQNSGTWSVEKNGHGTNDATIKWISDASVDFSKHLFTSHADFKGFVFPHTANFNSIRIKSGCRLNFQNAVFLWEATFETVAFPNRVDFRHAEFFGKATFRDSNFQSVARFNPTKFHNLAGFRRVRFSHNAWFGGARFKDDAVFSEATFCKTANFSNSIFVGLASFNWAESTGPFSLSEAKFEVVPDFTQMSFRAPVRLDDLEVVQARPFQRKGDKERAACYRALKKIAIESHDHLREQQFFASEARERRGNDDPTWSAKWWFSFAYELFSDFGRSFPRPLGLFFASILIFAAVYGTGSRFQCAWPKTWVLPELYLSLLNSLPLVGFARAYGRELAETCLFGGSQTLRPAMDIIFIGQNIWSAVLIFLFLLAVRNHFRIK